MRNTAESAGKTTGYRLCARAAALFAVLAVLLCAAAVFPAEVFAEPEEGAGGTRYIVKLRSEYEEPSGAGAPFEVVSEAEMLALRDAGKLEWYEEDGTAVLLEDDTAALFGDPSPYYADAKWDLAMVNADPAFERGYMGQGVKVGVIDSGVSPHPAFADRLLPGGCFVDGLDPSDTADLLGHGTRVSGLIAGNAAEGYIGAAPLSKIVPLRVTYDGSEIAISSICSAIYDGIDVYGCKVLNLSLGVANDYASLREAIEYAASRNVVVVAACGNDGNGTLYYPAAYESVIGVGGVDPDGSRHNKSNHNSSVFITAPGASVRTTTNSSGYLNSTGTSFSAPFAAAAAAVLLSIDGGLTEDEVMDTLASTAQDKGDPGLDEYYGYGIVDIGAAVAELAGSSYEPPEGDFEILEACGSPAAVKNNTNEALQYINILADYDQDGRFVDLFFSTVSVPAKRAVSIEPFEGGGLRERFCVTAAIFTPLF